MSDVELGSHVFALEKRVYNLKQLYVEHPSDELRRTIDSLERRLVCEVNNDVTLYEFMTNDVAKKRLRSSTSRLMYEASHDPEYLNWFTQRYTLLRPGVKKMPTISKRRNQLEKKVNPPLEEKNKPFLEVRCFGCRNQTVNLYNFNAWVAFVHLLNFAALMAVTFVNDHWDKNIISVVQLVATDQPGPNQTYNCDTTYPFPAILLSAIFALMSAGFQGYIALWGQDYYAKIVDKKYNKIRWMEYFFSSSVMMTILLVLTGVKDLYAVILGAFCNSAMILFGDLSDRFRTRETPTTPEDKHNAEVAFWYGGLIGFGPWLTLILGFAYAVDNYPNSSAIPWFLYVIPLVLFINFALFGVVQWFVIQGKASCFGRGNVEFDFKRGELCYIILSLTAKLALSWQAAGGLLFTNNT
jgi:hypothetical protein